MKSNVCNKSNCACNSCNAQPGVVVTQTTEGIKGLRNCMVYVTGVNTTYYVNDCHEITIISPGPVFVDGYDPVANKLGLRGQTCFDFRNNRALIFNEAGEFRIAELKEVKQ